jgi:acetate CoA/acetoacetate CoA-transferase beta subunit
MVLQEVAPGVTVDQVQAATGTKLIVKGEVPTMAV